jgi:hypothetical protein
VGQQIDKPAQLASLLDGLTLEHRQRLGYEGQPLLQMVCLSADGVPIAFCALPVSTANAAEAALQVDRLHGQTVAHWVDRRLAYVLVADLSPEVMAHAARGLVSGRFKRA